MLLFLQQTKNADSVKWAFTGLIPMGNYTRAWELLGCVGSYGLPICPLNSFLCWIWDSLGWCFKITQEKGSNCPQNAKLCGRLRLGTWYND